MSRKGEAASPSHPTAVAGVRLDKWLWAARFFKTRALAVEAIGHGHVAVNQQSPKASRDVRVGDQISLLHAGLRRQVIVRGLSHLRGPAPVAQALYEETAESIADRAKAAELRRYGVEPALDHAAGRPTKRDRRELVDWQRWSVSIDDNNR